MLDFGFTELLLIMAVAVLVVGPEQLPALMYRFGRLIQRLKGLQYALSRHFDDFMEQEEINRRDSLSGRPNGSGFINNNPKTEPAQHEAFVQREKDIAQNRQSPKDESDEKHTNPGEEEADADEEYFASLPLRNATAKKDDIRPDPQIRRNFRTKIEPAAGEEEKHNSGPLPSSVPASSETKTINSDAEKRHRSNDRKSTSD